MDREAVVYIYIQQNISQPLKEMHLSHFYGVDELRAYYTE